MKHHTKICLLLTGVWVLGIAAFIWFRDSDASEMNLNEWGDFAAGAVAPLAFFWLVIGYFQHGQELRLNTKALKTQEEELRRQAEETARLVDVTREEFSFLKERERRNARPDLVSTEAGQASPYYSRPGDENPWGKQILFSLQNRGGEVRDISITCKGSHYIFATSTIWEPNKMGTFMMRIESNEPPDYPISFSIICVDLIGNKHTFLCELLEDYNVNILAHDTEEFTGTDAT